MFGGTMKMRRPSVEKRSAFLAALAFLLGISEVVARAQETPLVSDGAQTSEARFDLHFQFTSVTQYPPGFPALYSGQNSLISEAEHAMLGDTLGALGDGVQVVDTR
jgi:hypothetical protein